MVGCVKITEGRRIVLVRGADSKVLKMTDMARGEKFKKNSIIDWSWL